MQNEESCYHLRRGRESAEQFPIQPPIRTRHQIRMSDPEIQRAPEVNMSLRLRSTILMMGLLAGLAGCAPNQNPDELKEKTARATAELKQNAKAVAEGVREGWSRDHPLNVNTATKEQLMSLPGVTAAEADKVIAGRPYDDPGELVTRGALPKNKYDRIADRLTAKK